jgi:hypothetical protein
MDGTGKPPSRASSLLQGIGVMHRTCGSQLAGECSGSGEMDGTGTPVSRASSLLQVLRRARISGRDEIIVGPALAGKAACQAIKLQQIDNNQIEQSDFTYAALIRVQPSPGLVCAQTVRWAPCQRK